MSLQTIAGIAGLIPYALLIAGILQSNVRQSFAAFLLWGMLDAIAFVTSLMEHGNSALALANAIGSTSIAILLLARKEISWGWTETMTALLVVVCMTIWMVSGERNALIASTAAVFLAGMPQMADTWKHPALTPLLPWLIFLVANVLAVYAGESWSVEERLYPLTSSSLTAIVIAIKVIRN